MICVEHSLNSKHLTDTRVCRRCRPRVALAALIASACLPWPAAAQSANASGTVALSSQLIDRGLAVTSDTAVVQGAASLALPSGWTLSVAAGTEARNATPLAEALAQASR